MTDITIKEDRVEMVIGYSEKFTTKEEMGSAIEGALELRGLVACEKEEVAGEME